MLIAISIRNPRFNQLILSDTIFISHVFSTLSTLYKELEKAHLGATVEESSVEREEVRIRWWVKYVEYILYCDGLITAAGFCLVEKEGKTAAVLLLDLSGH